MPKIFEENGFKFFFYSDEGDEPIHVHVLIDGDEAKFWLAPVRLAFNGGMSAKSLNIAHRLTILNEKRIKDKWNEHSAKKR